MNRIRAILALYVLVWFNVVVPGHTRGMITLKAGADDRPSAAAESCCTSDRPESPRDDAARSRAPSKLPCAVCYVAATYAPVVPVIWDFSPGEWTGIAAAEHDRDLRARGVELAIYPTGPPRGAPLPSLA